VFSATGMSVITAPQNMMTRKVIDVICVDDRKWLDNRAWFLQLLLEHTSELISIWDHQAQLLFATPVHDQYFGPQLPQHLDQLLQYVHRVDRDHIQKKIDEAFFRKKSAKVVYRFSGYDGCDYYIESIFNPVFSAAGALHYFVVVSRDVTENKLYEKQINEKKQMYRSLFDYNPNAVFSLDLKGNFTSCNQLCETLSGYTKNELTHMHYTALIKNEDRRKIIAWSSKLKQGVPVTFEIEIQRKDKKRADILLTNLPIFLNTKIVGFYGIAQDITESKQVQKKMYHMAYHDCLTALPNRAYFQEKIAEEIRQENPFSMVMIDIDRLKKINDNLGHYYGDCFLQEFSWRLKRIMGDEHLVARLSSDEFVILLRGVTSRTEIRAVIDQLFAMLDEPIHIERNEMVSTISVGISRFPRDGSNTEELLKQASIALHVAKEQ